MEIKANDLRIGNLVLLKCKNEKDEIGKLLTIDEINGCYYNKATNKKFINQKYDGRKNSWCKFEIINPIPLTEEWLLKFGLKKIEEYCFELDDIHVNTKRELMWITTKCKIELEFNIPNYIHELQNLYFALTGKEIETKNHSK